MPTEPQGITIDQQELYRKVDLSVFTLANLMNIIMVIIFLSRAAGATRSSIVGLIWVGFIVVLSIVVGAEYQRAARVVDDCPTLFTDRFPHSRAHS